MPRSQNNTRAIHCSSVGTNYASTPESDESGLRAMLGSDVHLLEDPKVAPVIKTFWNDLVTSHNAAIRWRDVAADERTKRVARDELLRGAKREIVKSNREKRDWVQYSKLVERTLDSELNMKDRTAKQKDRELLRERRMREIAEHKEKHDTRLKKLLSQGAMDKAVKQACRRDKIFCVIVIDLNSFKKVNDRYGHRIGNKILLTAQEAIVTSIRSYDIAGRSGGDELTILLPGCSIREGRLFAIRLAHKFDSTEAATKYGVSMSVGVANFKSHPGFVKILHAADQAMYAAKKHKQPGISKVRCAKKTPVKPSRRTTTTSPALAA